MAISDRVLARRQKDLDGWLEHYQGQLDARVAESGRELREVFEETHEYLERRVTKLYKEYEKLSGLGLDAAAQRVVYKLEHLTAIDGGIISDLEVLEGKLQPYYTQTLYNEYVRTYYEHGFGLSKSAQVATNVPLLTDSHVLGVIANPWVGDGANYSARLRRHTQHLAEQVESVIKIAVVEGLSTENMVKLLIDKTDESYNTAVTLLRTEMNRASSLAASYSYMKNNDVLDGKRWNATLDIDTAPRDADNDNKPADVDYDTPGNPGIPGFRIPNHPNCRCKWSPILSALGISNKGRIARVNGERSYTDAENYREWAREVGLPDLDARLKKDNPNKYLRKGETLSDLNKSVVRKSTAGGGIHVPEPVWAKAGKVDTTAEVAKTFKADDMPKVFTPAKTIKEANAWAASNLKVAHVDYKGYDVRMANDVNSNMQKLQERFPEVTSTKWITTAQARNAALYNRQLEDVSINYTDAGYDKATALKLSKKHVKRKSVKGTNFASSTNKSWGPQEGVCFNSKWAKDYDGYVAQKLGLKKSGWSAVGSPSGTVTHEFGHQLHNLLKEHGEDAFIDKAYAKFRQVANNRLVKGKHTNIRDAHAYLLSEYGSSNSAEFFAEAFAEALHNDVPRPIASGLMKELEEAMARVRSVEKWNG